MLKLLNKLYVRILIAVIFGFFLSAQFTHLQRPCTGPRPLEEVSSYCISLTKAIMHPTELVSDPEVRQKFITILALGFIGSFTIISIVASRIKK